MAELPAPQVYGWGEPHSVEDWLYAEPFAFEFVQAVRLLETFAAALNPPPNATLERLGAGSEPRREAVQLRADMGFAVAAGQVLKLSPGTAEATVPELTAAFGALAGAFGPLPDWVGEMVLRSSQQHDQTMRDFFDIFHHRLLSLVYRAAVHHRPWLAPALAAGQQGPAVARAANTMSQHLLALMGLGLKTLAGRSGVPDAELLPYAGLYWHRPRNVPGLQRILDHAFAETITILPMFGRWLQIEPADYTRLGARARQDGSLPPRGANPGRNRTLGRTTTLGTRFWNPQGRFELWIGPISYKTLEHFLPGRSSYRRLQAIVRSYAGELPVVHVHALVRDEAHPGARLPRTPAPGSKLSESARFGTARLGFTTLIASKKTQVSTADADFAQTSVHRVRLSPLPSRVP